MKNKKAATPHLIPGTNILKNKKGIDNRPELDFFERTRTAARMVDLPEGNLSTVHLKKIHAHLLQDVYEWAGKFRDIPTERGKSVFCRPEFIAQEADKITKWVDIPKFKKLDKEGFSKALGEIVGELNVVHPFLDGNGRTIRAYAQKISEKSGYELDITNIRGDRWNGASIEAYHSNSKGLAMILNENLKPLPLVKKLSAVETLKLKREKQALTKSRGRK